MIIFNIGDESLGTSTKKLPNVSPQKRTNEPRAASYSRHIIKAPSVT